MSSIQELKKNIIDLEKQLEISRQKLQNLQSVFSPPVPICVSQPEQVCVSPPVTNSLHEQVQMSVPPVSVTVSPSEPVIVCVPPHEPVLKSVPPHEPVPTSVSLPVCVLPNEPVPTSVSSSVFEKQLIELIKLNKTSDIKINVININF